MTECRVTLPRIHDGRRPPRRAGGFGKIAVAFAALLLAEPSFCGEKTLHVTVFHTNDIHGWIMARDAGRMDPADPKRKVGGFAALASLVRAHNGPHLLLDDGDWFQGTPEGGETKGQASIRLMNLLGYDAAEIGNHDFDDGAGNLKDLVSQAKFPVLGANVYEEKTGKRAAFLKDHILKDVAGVRFGIFGLLTTNMPALTFAKNYGGLRFRDEIEEARDQVAALKKEGATVIIALTHVGLRRGDDEAFEDDRAIAAAVPGIDLIVGGHSHTRLSEPLREPTHGTWIVQAGNYLQYAGVVDLSIDPASRRVANVSGSLVPLWTDQLPEDPAALAAVEAIQAQVGKELDVAIGKAAAPISRSQGGESQMGDWMTDCMRSWAHADAAFQNSGGIRDDIAEGSVTLREIYDVMPFDNAMVVLRLPGRYLKDVLENGIGGGHGIIQVSGVRFTYDPKGLAGQRVLSAEVGGKPLRTDAVYTVVASDFMTTGGDGYTAFSKAQETEKKGVLLRDVLAQCARETPAIVPPQLDRIHSEVR